LLSRKAGPECPKGLLAGTVLVCSGGGKIVVYDTDGLGEKWRMQIQSRELVLSEEGERLFVFVDNAHFMVLDAQDGSVLRTSQREWHLDRWAHSRDPAHLLSLRNGSGREYAVVGSQKARGDGLLCEERLQAAALLEDGDIWYSCGEGHLAKRQAGETQEFELPPLVAFPWRIVTSVDQSQLAIGGMHGEVQVVDATSGETLWFADFGDEFVGRMRFSPDGRWLQLVTSGESSWVVDLASGAKHQLPGMARAMAFSPQGELLAFGREGFETWSLPPGAPAYNVGGGVVSLDWHTDGLAMLSGNQAAFAPNGGRLERTAEGPIGNKSVLVRSPEELLIGALETLYRWVPGEPRVPVSGSPVRRLHGLPGGRIFVTAIEKTMVLEGNLEPVPGTRLVGFQGVESAASIEGNFVAAIAGRGRLIWLDSASLEYREMGEFPDVQALGVAPEGWPIYLGDSDGVTALAETSELVTLLETGSPVVEIAVSDDGLLLAVACEDKAVRVVARERGEVLGVLHGHTRRIAALDFSPDSQELASGGWDDRVLIWDMASLEVDPQLALEEAEQRWGLTTETALK
jgi:WD40 repeat protein